MRIKIYGERNTGTNYLEQLIALNLVAEVLRPTEPYWLNLFGRLVGRLPRLLGGPRAGEAIKGSYFKFTTPSNLGWKHSMVSAELLEVIQNYPHEVLFLVLTKNPYAFLLSLYKRPYQYRRHLGSFDQFLLDECPTDGRDHSSGYANPVAMWNEKHRGYLELERTAPTVLLKFEDLVLDPENVIEGICACHGIKKQPQHFRNVEQSTKKDQGKDFAYYQKYYVDELWKTKLTNRNIEIINGCLDRTIMERFGYKEITLGVRQATTLPVDSSMPSGG